MTELVTTKMILERTLVAAVRGIVSELEPALGGDAPDAGPRRVPRDLRMWLARLRLLEAVPFSHLVADTTLLPLESIRFFHLDRGWTDALVEGALSVGTVTTTDRAALEQLYPVVRDEVDEAERLVRLVGWEPGAAVPTGPAGPITGFVLRSRMVSGWPALHVRAYGNDNLSVSPAIADQEVDDAHDGRLAKLPLLRMERLAPAVLLVLIDGLPRVVHVEEPRAGVQYGVDETVAGTTAQATVRLRDVKTAKRLTQSVRVPFRRGAPGVVHVAELAKRMRAVPQTNVENDVDASEFGIQMLQFPWRAVFGDQKLADPGAAVIDLADVFRPALGFDVLKVRFATGGPR